jgi:hypothetical protein
MEKKDAKFDIRLPLALATAAKAKADQLNRSLADVIRELLRAWLAGASDHGSANK